MRVFCANSITAPRVHSERYHLADAIFWVTSSDDLPILTPQKPLPSKLFGTVDLLPIFLFLVDLEFSLMYFQFHFSVTWTSQQFKINSWDGHRNNGITIKILQVSYFK